MNTENAFALLHDQELTDAEVRAVLARYSRPGRNRALVLALAALIAALVAVAVPPSRAELADAIRAALLGGDLPGHALPTTETPEWLRQTKMAGGGEPRVIAEVDGQTMLVFRQSSGTLCFDFGGRGICGMKEADLFAEQPVALFGPTKVEASGRFQLWGLTLAAVASVELRFADAPPVHVSSVGGAFGIALEPDARPTTLIAYDASGRVIAEQPVSERWSRRPAM